MNECESAVELDNGEEEVPVVVDATRRLHLYVSSLSVYEGQSRLKHHISSR